MSDWHYHLPALLDRAWQVLVRAAENPGHPARFVTLASLAPSGAPEARLLGLRRADRAAGAVTLYTDAASGKIAGLQTDGRVSVLLWEPDLQLQLRLRGTCAVVTGTPVQPVWDALPDPSRGNYGVTPAPGTPIAEARAYDRRPDPARLALLEITLHQIDAVHLGAEPHSRALYDREGGWAGGWLAP